MSRGEGLLRRWFLHAQRIFHLLVGAAFLFFALAGAAVSWSEWHYYQRAPSVGVYRFGLVLGFTVLLLLLGLYTFAKARSVR
jgi:hypothetical protein